MLLLRDLVATSGVEFVRHLQHPEMNRMPRYQLCADPCNKAYLRPETYSDALTRIIDAHHALPFAQIWGQAEHTSSDGQFFAAARNL
jgi:hypothetical protein